MRGDFEAAVAEWGPLADMGDPMAQLNIGLCYLKGEGLARNPAEGAKWVRKAAEQHLPEAQRQMAEFYMADSVLGKDYLEAEKWYRQAAMQADAVAQLQLGALYSTGRGVETDWAEAYKWFSLAAARGQAGSRIAVVAATEHLSRAQIEEARDQVAAFSVTLYE
jgi:TPR repeat protein